MRFVLVGLLCLCFASMSQGAPRSFQRFTRGEKVKVQSGAEVYTAEVVGMLATGWVKVRFTDKSGFEHIIPFPPNSLQRTGKSSKSAMPEKTAGDRDVAEKKPVDAVRIWTDKSGKFTIRARFLELTNGRARLEQDDGKIVVIPLGQLSDADRAIAENSAITRNANPFQPTEAASPAEAANAAEEETNEAAAAPRADWSGVQRLTAREARPWKLTADRGSPKPLQPKGILLRAPKMSDRRLQGLGSKIDALVFVRQRYEALVFTSDRGGSLMNSDPSFLVHRVDLAKGKASDPFALKADGVVLDVDPAGQRVALASKGRSHGANAPWRLQVWEIGKVKRGLISTWDPVDANHDEGRPFVHLNFDPPRVRFVDADYLLSASESSLVLWEVSTRRALYQMSLSGSAAFALSANGKYLAAGTDGGVAVFDPLTGNTLGKLHAVPLPDAVLSFEPNGAHLAALTPSRVVVWDFEKGEEDRNVYFPTTIRAESLDWVADGDLLADNSKLIDLQRRVVLWEYLVPRSGQRGERTCGERGDVFWYAVSAGNQHGIIGLDLPHEAAKQKAASLNAEDLLVLKAGARVKLVMQISTDPAQEQQIADRLTQQLRDMGMEANPSSSLVLSAGLENGRTEQRTYETRAPGAKNHNTETVNVTGHFLRLRLRDGEKLLWEATSAQRAPIAITVARKSDQSLQQAVDAQNKPDLSFFNQTELPRFLARPGDGSAYGASALSESGIRDVPIETLHAGSGPPNARGQARGRPEVQPGPPATQSRGGL